MYEEDLIDFPCSDTFAEFYAEQGLTKGFPPEYWRWRRNTDPYIRDAEAIDRRFKEIGLAVADEPPPQPPTRRKATPKGVEL